MTDQGDGQGMRQVTGLGDRTRTGLAEVPPGVGDDAGPEAGDWVSVAEAARRLGVTPRAVRNRIERGTIGWRPKGNEGREVFLRDGGGQGDSPEKPLGDGSQDGPADGQGDRLAGLLDELREERERREAAELRAAVAVREVELTRELLAEVRADRDRTAELLKLALDRPGWVERLTRVLRGAGRGEAGRI